MHRVRGARLGECISYACAQPRQVWEVMNISEYRVENSAQNYRPGRAWRFRGDLERRCHRTVNSQVPARVSVSNHHTGVQPSRHAAMPGQDRPQAPRLGVKRPRARASSGKSLGIALGTSLGRLQLSEGGTFEPTDVQTNQRSDCAGTPGRYAPALGRSHLSDNSSRSDFFSFHPHLISPHHITSQCVPPPFSSPLPSVSPRLLPHGTSKK